MLAVLLLSSGLLTPRVLAGTAGTFLGEVVKPPQGERSLSLVYLRGRDGNVRRVIVARAAVVYAATVPTEERQQPARKALIPGAEVRITALVDAKSGEWTASRVEVIAQQAAEVAVDRDDDSLPDEITSPGDSTVASRTI